MKIRPLHDRVLVRRKDESQTSPGGIVIPDSAKEKPIRGEVLAVGHGKVLEDGTTIFLDLREGDEILFGKHSGTEIQVDGEELLMMREDDVVGVVEAEERS